MANQYQNITEDRVNKIVDWIIEGLPDYQLESKIKEEFGIKLRQARRYKKKAFDIWKVTKENDIDIVQRRNARIDELRQDIQNLDVKYRKTPAGLTAILRIKKEISRLEDLYPEKKIKLSNDPENPVSGFGDNITNQTVIFQIPDNHRDS